MMGTPPLDRYYQFLRDDYAKKARDNNGMAALVEGLRALASNPEITAGEESGQFAAGLLALVEGSYSGELMALFPSVAGALRVAGKHKNTRALKARILSECEKYRQGNRWKNAAARKVAPIAYDWNREAGKPFAWLDISAAERQVRRWL